MLSVFFSVALCLQSAESVEETLYLPDIDCLFQVAWETDLGSSLMLRGEISVLRCF